MLVVCQPMHWQFVGQCIGSLSANAGSVLVVCRLTLQILYLYHDNDSEFVFHFYKIAILCNIKSHCIYWY